MWRALNCLALLFVCAAGAPVALAMQAVGTAFSTDGEQPLYREYHSCEPGTGSCTVEYRHPEGEVFARKWLDYSESARAPSLRFEDLRSGQQLSVESEAISAGVVIDAGFDNFVRERWESLYAGEAVAFEFLPADRSKPFAMEASRLDECDAGRMCLRVAPDSWLLSLFGGAIELVYSEDERRLLEFRGISNIRDGEGGLQTVLIKYRYSP